MQSVKQLTGGSKDLRNLLREENEMEPLKGTGNFTPAPEGLWPGVCVDVVDKGIVKSAIYKPRHMIQIRWMVNAEPPLPDGRPHICARMFGYTLAGENNKLRPFLEAWRGRAFTEEELRGFDPEKLLGVNGQVQIIHNHKNGNTYGNVQAVVPAPRGSEKMLIPADYIRQQERDRRAELEKFPDGKPEEEYETPYPATDEDIPF
jgi:hypothetical protein